MEVIKGYWIVKNHFWISLLIGIGFLAVLQTGINTSFTASIRQPFASLGLWVTGFCFVVFFYNRKYLKFFNQYAFFKALRIPLLILAGAWAFVVLPTPFLRGFFLLFSMVVVASFEGAVASFSENLLINEVLFTSFAVFLGSGAWAFLYFPEFRFYIALATFVFIFFLSRSFFEYTLSSAKTKLVCSLVTALLIAELFWIFGLLPQHYSVLSLSLTAAYYLILITNYNYLFNNLDFKKIQFYLFFTALCIILVFLTSAWKIL